MNANYSVIVGLGITGLSCVKFFEQNHQPVVVMDTRASPPGLETLHQYSNVLKVVTGTLDLDVLLQAEQVIVSPGIAWAQHPVLISFLASGRQLIGDVELFLQYAQAPICAITGSNGKSTVTTLVTMMGQRAGLNVLMGGNIGQPVLSLLDQPTPDFYVLELSSFQLELIFSLKAKAATILNISADHLDRHGTMKDYIAAKQRIYQQAEQMIYLRSDANTFPQVKHQDHQLWSFDVSHPQSNEFGIFSHRQQPVLARGETPLMQTAHLLLQGKQHELNALAAFALGQAMGIDTSAMVNALKDFSGLPHRCEKVAQHKGVLWFNDSKGTNEGATLVAINSVGETVSGQVILIAGGQAKGADFQNLVQPVKQFVSHAILFGEDAKVLQQALAPFTTVTLVDELSQAVQTAGSLANSGDAILFSPACASFDMFDNFVHRGETFKQRVQEYCQ